MTCFSFRRNALRAVAVTLSLWWSVAYSEAAPLPTVSHGADQRPYLGRVCDPVSLGAAINGQHDDTTAIQQAIDRCGAEGGGTVPLHAGTYLSGPLSLASHVTLFLEPHSRLQAIGNRARYTWAFLGLPTRPHEALILASNVSDVAILGSGTIDGDGARLWWPAARAAHAAVLNGAKNYGAHYPDVPVANGLPRPWLIEFSNVKHARIGAILATNSPMWNVVLRDSADVRVNGLRIVNPPDSRNTDGIDIVSSTAISMSKLDISTGDDDIAIKSGLPALKMPPRPTTNILISDSTIRRGHGVSVGSETSNGIESVHLSKLNFIGTESGVRIKSGRDRGADIGDIDASKLSMRDVATPVSISDYYGGEPGRPAIPPAGEDKGAALTATTPHLHDVSISDLDASGAETAGMVVGLPEAIATRVVFRRVHIVARHAGLRLRNMQGMFDDVDIDSPGSGLIVEENVKINGKKRPST